jgi:hypothetical protein
LQYPEAFIARGLPSLRAAHPDSQPKILLWDDRTWDNDGYLGDWIHSLAALGYRLGREYDLYVTKIGLENALNGLGTRATVSHLLNYRTLLYDCGKVMSTGFGETEINFSLLDGWLQTGGKNILLMGDGFVSDMLSEGGMATNFVDNWLPVNLVQANVRPVIDDQATPLVKTHSGNPVFYQIDEWIAYGGCPGVNWFDAVEPRGNSVSLAEFTDRDGQTGVYPYAAGVYHYHEDHDVETIYLPYSFSVVMTPHGGTKTAAPNSARTRVLEDILIAFSHEPGSSVIGVPEVDVFSVKSYPNPFNPTLKIAYHMPRRGELTIKIYNVRGELVRTVIDEVVEAGDAFVLWDGTDSHGQAVASGVYFYETRVLGQTHVNKIALVK